MNKNKFFIPALRMISILYIIYKVFFSDLNLDWSKIIEFDNSSAAALTGDILIRVLFGFIFVTFIIYQFRQSKLEFRQKINRRSKLRLLSITWSILFYLLATISIFNVNLENENTMFIEYLTEFYTVSTIIGVIAGLIVIVRDIKIFALLRKNKTTF